MPSVSPKLEQCFLPYEAKSCKYNFYKYGFDEENIISYDIHNFAHLSSRYKDYPENDIILKLHRPMREWTIYFSLLYEITHLFCRGHIFPKWTKMSVWMSIIISCIAVSSDLLKKTNRYCINLLFLFSRFLANSPTILQVNPKKNFSNNWSHNDLKL